MGGVDLDSTLSTRLSDNELSSWSSSSVSGEHSLSRSSINRAMSEEKLRYELL